MNLPYDSTDATSIEQYARGLIGHTFRDVVEADIIGIGSQDDVGSGMSVRCILTE